MGHTGGAVLINQRARIKSVNSKGCRQRMGMIIGYRICKYIARARRGFKAPSTPAAVKIQPVHRGFTDNWAGVWTGVYNTAPLSIHTHSAKGRKQLTNSLQCMFNNME